jgi:hypothetical protein
MRLLVVLIAALVLAGAAGADVFTDSSGEDPASADIGTVTVTNDPTAKTVSFQVAITNMPTMEDGAGIAISLDTDLNPATGSDGAEYQLTYDNTGAVLGAWDGAEFAATSATDLTSSYTNGVMAVQFLAADIGSPSGFNFTVGTVRGADPNNPGLDQAPDPGSSPWTYTLRTAAPPPPPPPTTTSPTQPPPGKKKLVTVSSTHVLYSGKPKAGKSFVVRGLRLDLSTGAVTGATSLQCTATLAGKALKGVGKTRCTFHLVTRAKGKRLIVHARGRYQTTAVKATASWKVA